MPLSSDLILIISFYLPHFISKLIIKSKNLSPEQYRLLQVSYLLNLDKQTVIQKLDQIIRDDISNLLATYGILIRDSYKHKHSYRYRNPSIYPHLVANYGNAGQTGHVLGTENPQSRFNQWDIFHLCQRHLGELTWANREKHEWSSDELIVYMQFGYVKVSSADYTNILNQKAVTNRIERKTNLHIGDLDFILMLVLAHPNENIINKFELKLPDTIEIPLLQYYDQNNNQQWPRGMFVVHANTYETIIVALRFKSVVAFALQQNYINIHTYLGVVQQTGHYDMLLTLFSIQTEGVKVVTIGKQSQLNYLFTKFISYYLADLIDKKVNNDTYWILKTGWQLNFVDL